MNPSVLLVGNFLSSAGGSRGVCEELALRLAAGGSPVVTASDKPARLHRLLDMISTVFKQRGSYRVAQVDVFSGPAFVWAEAVCALLHWLDKPFVLTLHGGNLPGFARRHPGRVRRLLNSASVVTTPSRYLLEKMSGCRADLRLLPNALDLGRYPFKLREAAKPSLVWLRAFHEIYNPSLAPTALQLLAKKFPQAHLTMIGPDKGDGSLDRTRRTAAELGVSGRLALPGAVAKTSVPRWLGQADIFLNTSHVDNTPVSVLEAMACGLCVVSTNVGGIPHLMEDGREGLLVPPNDAPAMASAVSQILAEPPIARRLSRNARARAEEHDWSVVLPQWQALFRSVATESDWPPLRQASSGHEKGALT